VTSVVADGARLTAKGSNDDPATTHPRSWWWRHHQRRGNLGDALNLLVLDAFGLTAHRSPASEPPKAPDHGSPLTPTLLAIGSMVDDRVIADRHARCVVWGSGWRGNPLSDATRALLDVRAVRGPHTAAALGLTGQVPLGDPALLLPRILDPDTLRRTRRPTGRPPVRRAIVVPHVNHISGAPEVGCDVTVTAGVRQTDLWGRFSTTDVVRRVRSIANASFVLAGALHAAVIAQAYGVPWAAWRGPDVDCPAKWDDWAAYLGIELEFAPDRAAGERWWTDHGSTGTVGDLTGLVAAFPYDALGMTAPSPRPVS
jgi:hypothetical protein